jgi:hypothetical protein
MGVEHMQPNGFEWLQLDWWAWSTMAPEICWFKGVLVEFTISKVEPALLGKLWCLVLSLATRSFSLEWHILAQIFQIGIFQPLSYFVSGDLHRSVAKTWNGHRIASIGLFHVSS